MNWMAGVYAVLMVVGTIAFVVYAGFAIMFLYNDVTDYLPKWAERTIGTLMVIAGIFTIGVLFGTYVPTK